MTDIADIIRQSAARYGMDPNAWLKTAQIESDMNPNSRTGHAQGLFQFMPQTWHQYGHGNVYDPAANTDAAMRLAQDNAKQFTAVMGRSPTPGETYLMHQQGPGGAMKLLQHPDAPAVAEVGRGAVVGNAGRPNMTSADFASLWTSRFDQPGAGAGSQQPTAPQAPGTSAIPSPATTSPLDTTPQAPTGPVNVPNLADVFQQTLQKRQRDPAVLLGDGSTYSL